MLSFRAACTCCCVCGRQDRQYLNVCCCPRMNSMAVSSPCGALGMGWRQYSKTANISPLKAAASFWGANTPGLSSMLQALRMPAKVRLTVLGKVSFTRCWATNRLFQLVMLSFGLANSAMNSPRASPAIYASFAPAGKGASTRSPTTANGLPLSGVAACAVAANKARVITK